MRFLDVKTDYAFKKVFGSLQSKPVLIDFLNAMLDYTGDRAITDLDIVDPYQVPVLKGMKDTYVDVKAVLANGSTVIIEMQVLNVKGFEARILYNAAKHYANQLQEGEHFTSLCPVIALTLADFVMFHDDKDTVISHFKLIEKKRFIEYTGDIELIFVELPKFTKTIEELENIQDKWIYFIKNSGRLDYIPETMTSPMLQQAFTIINKAGMSQEELEIQHKRIDFILLQRGALEKASEDGLQKGIQQGIQQGIQEGIQQGRQAERAAIAWKALQSGLTPQQVAGLVGLTEAEVMLMMQNGQTE